MKYYCYTNKTKWMIIVIGVPFFIFYSVINNVFINSIY